MEPFKHVTAVRLDLNMKLFTRQGSHMNNLGKERIAVKIANAFTTVFQKQTEEPISQYWKTKH